MTQRAAAYRDLIAHVYELAGTSRTTSETVARAHGRTAAQGHVMSVASDGEWTVAAVARRLGLSRQAVQRVVHDLARGGQVTLEPNPSDARSHHVLLTEAGRASLAAITGASDLRREQMLSAAGVTTAELEQAGEVVRRLLGALRQD